ncbi:hypothetical protein FCV25MIE_33818, partial [Fagus crenata]
MKSFCDQGSEGLVHDPHDLSGSISSGVAQLVLLLHNVFKKISMGVCKTFLSVPPFSIYAEQ